MTKIRKFNESVSDLEKDVIKKEVIKILDTFCKERFEEIEFPTEGSLTEDYKYLSANDVSEALNMCFNETYKRTKNE